MTTLRVLRHLWFGAWQFRRAFPTRSLKVLTGAIRDSERTHRGEIHLAVEGCLSLPRLVRGQSARARALEVFSLLRVWDTEENNGVLIYLLLADRDVEIVADRGIHRVVGNERWEVICQEMEVEFGAGRFEAGCLAGIRAVGGELARHYGGADSRGNELPNRPTLL